jgi:hypothetical protein
MTLHELLDFNYHSAALRRLLNEGADPNARQGPQSEMPAALR